MLSALDRLSIDREATRVEGEIAKGNTHVEVTFNYRSLAHLRELLSGFRADMRQRAGYEFAQTQFDPPRSPEYQP